ncbi:Bcr/CflA family multidrug efflux MFS transporter [Mangrovitalea sediminis]|uniref:Bcr/CflA family multidrug efflux MFS transporter n=1 Tax=Mangrovitalea sediminis TaxID=1982043 RepID=UPI000BE53B8D|nr:Bcr/CflA family multidrug efflux MFS transporter [Mangrovitalea sediminis]
MPESASKGLILLLGALTAFAPMSIDMYLPSFPQLGQSLQASPGAVQFSLAIFFIGLSVGQAIYGPLSDHYGRRPLLLIGISIYILASIGCSLATDIETLIAMRLMQALGGCAGVVLARAVVRDLFDYRTVARVFSALMLVMGLAPILAPLLGGWVLTHYGWRAIFIILTLFGFACLVGVIFGLKESRPAATVQPLHLGRTLRTYLSLLRDPLFLGYALAGGVSMAGMFAYITGSPFVFIQLYHVSPSHFGWLFGLNAAGFIAASQINARLLSHCSPEALLRPALKVGALCGLILFACAATGFGGLVGLMVPLFCFIASLGFINPNSTAGALRHQGHQAGSAAALLGAFQFGAATLSGATVGLLQDGTARPLGGVIAVATVIAFLAHARLIPKDQTANDSH